MNEEIRKSVGSKRNVIQLIKETKLNLFGHNCRMEDNRLVKEVVFEEMEGKTKRGRPHKEWLDDIKEWCNEEIHELKRKMQDRDTLKQIVIRSYTVWYGIQVIYIAPRGPTEALLVRLDIPYHVHCTLGLSAMPIEP